ncbi:MAG TPA: zinc-binding dehydrogenase [Gemmatimonadales bacterium]|jgi:NADPH:quinone reductase-like Zn-dependent oxidoreductase
MRGHGDLDQLEMADVPTPELVAPHDVLVRLSAAALNHLDLWTLAGLPGLSLAMPHILGGDGAGVVERVGPAVRNLRPGDRVLVNPGIWCGQCSWCQSGEQSLCDTYRILGEHLPGTLAEYIVVPDVNLARVPDIDPPLSWAEAAAFSLVTLTAWRMLMTRAALKAGETVLVWGVGGGVGTAALQIAKAAGAQVIVTSSSDAKLDRARALGADAVINYRTAEVSKEVRKLTQRRGADVVVDNVGEATWEQSLRALARRGRLVTCGATTGPHVVTDVRRLFWHQYTIMGSTMGNADEFTAILTALGAGKLRPVVDRVFPLSEAVDAVRRLQGADHMGKIVVEPGR